MDYVLSHIFDRLLAPERANTVRQCVCVYIYTYMYIDISRVFQPPLTLILPKKYCDTMGSVL